MQTKGKVDENEVGENVTCDFVSFTPVYFKS